jgi:hypothetical protein
MASCILGDVDEAGVLFQPSRPFWSRPKSRTTRNSDCRRVFRCLDPIIRGQELDVSD